MSCVLFLLLKFLGRWESPYDTYLFLLLLAIELPNWMMVWLYHRRK